MFNVLKELNNTPARPAHSAGYGEMCTWGDKTEESVRVRCQWKSENGEHVRVAQRVQRNELCARRKSED